MYAINYSKPAHSYLGDNRFNYYVAGVYVELKLLSASLDGLPDDRDSCYHLSETERVYWLVEHHFVSYERGTNKRYVTEIKPLE